jgi:hypothetical protein
MQMEIVRDANGQVLAAIDLSGDDGVVPEVVLEEGNTSELVEIRRAEFFDDVDGAFEKFSQQK